MKNPVAVEKLALAEDRVTENVSRHREGRL